MFNILVIINSMFLNKGYMTIQIPTIQVLLWFSRAKKGLKLKTNLPENPINKDCYGKK